MMKSDKKKLEKQMLRCFLLGYIATRHNENKIVAQSTEFSSHREFKIFSAKEKLSEYGMPRWLACVIIRVALRMELILSIFMCSLMYVCYSISFIFTKKRDIKGRKLFPKLNVQESRAISLYASAGLDATDVLAIDIPEQYTKYKKIPTVSVFSGITYSQLCSSFLCSVRLSWFMIRKYSKKDTLFRTYSSFPFFLCFFFISNLDNSNELVFYNHYDRWMYLLGSSHLRKTYIQHGKLWIDFIPRICCDDAYYLSHSQQSVLEHTLFKNKPVAHFRKVFDYSGLEKLKANGNKDLLIVCLNLFADKHETIVKQLYGKNINIYLKPHPQDNFDIYKNINDLYPNIVVLDRFDYPKVDYIISYDSTLADEYEMHDLPVLKYSDKDFNERFKCFFGEYPLL